LVSTWLENARAKVREANDPASALSREELVDDVAITSMSRLWDVGKSEPIKIGKASPTEGALPAALYFAIKYQDDPEAALIANANCGGDSAARGIVIGMLLGAGAEHDSALPRDHRWVRGLNARPAVEALIDSLVHVDKPTGEL
jgi:ADP-ribosylglycohydrolase